MKSHNGPVSQYVGARLPLGPKPELIDKESAQASAP